MGKITSDKLYNSKSIPSCTYVLVKQYMKVGSCCRTAVASNRTVVYVYLFEKRISCGGFQSERANKVDLRAHAGSSGISTRYMWTGYLILSMAVRLHEDSVGLVTENQPGAHVHSGVCSGNMELVT